MKTPSPSSVTASTFSPPTTGTGSLERRPRKRFSDDERRTTNDERRTTNDQRPKQRSTISPRSSFVVGRSSFVVRRSSEQPGPSICSDVGRHEGAEEAVFLAVDAGGEEQGVSGSRGSAVAEL